MNLSWFDNGNSILAEDLIGHQTKLDSTVPALPWNQPSKLAWVRNNGIEGSNDPLIDFGFFITCNKLNDMNKILLEGGKKDEDGYPYGLFVIFGHKLVEGNYISYITEFANGNLTQEELAMFHINWNQGTSALNKIKIKNIPYIYDGASQYYNTGNFPVYFGLPENGLSETRGKLLILVAVRSTQTLKADFELLASASNESEA